MREQAGQTIGCEEALRYLFAYLDHQLGRVKQRELEQHLEVCRACFSKAEFERRLKVHLRAAGRSSVQVSFCNRIQTLLKHL